MNHPGARPFGDPIPLEQRYTSADPIDWCGAEVYPMYAEALPAGTTAVRLRAVSVLAPPEVTGLGLGLTVQGGYVHLNGKSLQGVDIWYDALADGVDITVTVDGPEPLFTLTPVWVAGSGSQQSWTGNYGMVIDLFPGGASTLWCSTGPGTPDFNELVVELTTFPAPDPAPFVAPASALAPPSIRAATAHTPFAPVTMPPTPAITAAMLAAALPTADPLAPSVFSRTEPPASALPTLSANPNARPPATGAEPTAEPPASATVPTTRPPAAVATPTPEALAPTAFPFAMPPSAAAMPTPEPPAPTAFPTMGPPVAVAAPTAEPSEAITRPSTSSLAAAFAQLAAPPRQPISGPQEPASAAADEVVPASAVLPPATGMRPAADPPTVLPSEPPMSAARDFRSAGHPAPPPPEIRPDRDVESTPVIAAPTLRAPQTSGGQSIGRALYDLGTAMNERGEHDSARTLLTQAAEAGHSAAAYDLGVLLLRDGDRAGAEHWWKAAAHDDPRAAASLTELPR